MATRRDVLKWSLAAAAASFGTGLLERVAQAQVDEQLAMVVAQSSPLKELSLYELKRLYLGSPVLDPAGERIIPFNQMPRAPDRVRFETRVLGMTPDEVARYWIDRKIRGQGGAPKAVGPADLLQRVVSRLTHSVAYVRADQVADGMRVISIDGRVPGDTAYRLYI